MKGRKLRRGRSKRNFRNGAKTHRYNLRATPMRGGWRM